jgi:hypothetical protein
MHECPHCHQESISTLQKLLAISPLQLSCKACQQHSYIHNVYALVALTVWIMSFLLFGSIPAMVIAVDRYLIKAPLSKVQV